MTKSQLGLLGSVFAAGALAVAGCGGGGGGGTGGKIDGGSAGGKGGTAAGGTTGTGGKGGAAGGAAGTTTVSDGGTDNRADSGSGGTDARTDTGPGDTGPCATSFGAGSQLLYSFDSGYSPWFPEVSGLDYAFGATKTDGHTCPGAVTMTVQFASYGDPSASLSTTFNNTPQNWSSYVKLHIWVRLITTNYAAVNGVQSFINSNGYANYSNSNVFLGGSTFSDGNFHEVVFDLLHPNPFTGAVVLGVINKMGVQVLVQDVPQDGGVPAAAPIQLLVDDVWLEAAPPPDAGLEVGPDATTDTPADVGVDASSADTGVDATTG
jgi:hypothetical protein